MNQDEITAIFEKQADGYDRQWEAMAPIRGALQRVAEVTLGGLPVDARILSVGTGTGAELAHLAERFPQWRFTAVEPATAMYERCRERSEREGFADRCTFHNGYLETLPDPTGPEQADPEQASPEQAARERGGTGGRFDAAVCFLVSQFLVDREARIRFFAEIAGRLVPGGVLLSSDLAAPADEIGFETLLRTWMTIMAGETPTEERLEGARTAYTRDVAVLPPPEVASIIGAAGFAPVTQVFQAGMLHAWVSIR